MKYIQVIALAVFFHLVLNLFMPWWNIFIAGTIAGYFSKINALKTFLLVFLGIFVYWLILMLKIDHSNTGVFSAKLAELLEVGNKSVLFSINAIVGAICAACASQVGLMLKRIVRKNKNLA